jgi:NDP-sugar pyrophosphorylase family protein
MGEQIRNAMPSLALLVGGMATRLWPLTKKVPKAIIEVAGKPFIAHQMALLKKKGITDVVICAGYLGGQIKDFVKNGESFGIRASYSFDGEKLLGTGGALNKALPLLGDIFFVMYGDSYLDTDYSSVLRFFVSMNKKGLMTVFRNNNQWGRSNVLFKNGLIHEYNKKNPRPEMKHIDYGLNLLRREAFTSIPEGKVFDLADLYAELVEQNDMLGYEVKERFYEIGSQDSLKETEAYLRVKGVSALG